MLTAWHRPSLEFEYEPQRLVDGREFVDGQLADEVSESFRCYGRRLLNEDLR